MFGTYILLMHYIYCYLLHRRFWTCGMHTLGRKKRKNIKLPQHPAMVFCWLLMHWPTSWPKAPCKPHILLFTIHSDTCCQLDSYHTMLAALDNFPSDPTIESFSHPPWRLWSLNGHTLKDICPLTSESLHFFCTVSHLNGVAVSIIIIIILLLCRSVTLLWDL